MQRPGKKLNAGSGFGVEPRDRVWEAHEIRAFLSEAPAKLHTAAALLFYTAQRLSDVLSMDWSRVFEKKGRLFLRLRQRKTGQLIDVPAHRDLEAMLRPVMKKSGILVMSPWTDDVWQERNFARAWDAVMKEADLDSRGLQRRDLRRTAMCRMAEAGATEAQIAAVSGHSIEQTRKILATYIPRRGEIAAGAIAAWEMLDETQGSDELLQLAETGERLLEARDRERALKLARKGLSAEDLADTFGRSREQAEEILQEAIASEETAPED